MLTVHLLTSEALQTMTIYEKVIRGVKWHAFESITYQMLLCSHRFVLYKAVGATLFGTISCVFATVYGLIFFGNIGFNDGIVAFFKEISASQKTAQRFFIQHCIPHLCILFVLPLLVRILPFATLSAVSPTLFFAATALFIAESIRITLRTLLQLTFINKELTVIDLGGLCCYIATIWLIWYSGRVLTPFLVIFALAATSCIQVILLINHMLHWYAALPQTSTDIRSPSYRRVMRVRLFSYTHHMLSSHVMSNIIVPYSAYMWGLEYASLTKLLASASQLITTILKHTVGFSSLALFSHLKHAPSAQKRYLLGLINRFLVGALIAALIICAGLYNLLEEHIAGMHTHTFVISILLLVLTFENCFIPYEAAYLSEERPEAMALMYAAGAGILYAAFSWSTQLNATSPLVLAISFLGIRLCSLGILSGMLTYRWKTENS